VWNFELLRCCCVACRTVVAAAGLAMLAAGGGCGSSDLPLATTYGTVTYKGKPLDHGQVIFTLEKPGSGQRAVPSVGGINADGSYEMRTGARKGSPLGRFIVSVHCHKIPTEEEKQALRIMPSLIPTKYANEQSPLRFEVKSGSNEFNIVLE
jgi:hypothetical protein